MKAEEKLAQWYKEGEPQERTPEMVERGEFYIQGTCGVYIAPEHIDLIADLVVERLKSKE